LLYVYDFGYSQGSKKRKYGKLIAFHTLVDLLVFFSQAAPIIIVFTLRPSYGFMLRIYDIYIVDGTVI